MGALTDLVELLALPVYETSAADRLNFPTTHWAYGCGGRIADADLVLVVDAVTPYVAGVNAPPADARIVWIAPDPVLSRYKTIEHRADRWLPADSALTLRTLVAAVTDRLSSAHRDRVDRRRAALVVAAAHPTSGAQRAANRRCTITITGGTS